jgi:hypothetical protein
MRTDDSSPTIDILQLVRDHGRQATLVAIGTAFLVAAVAAFYLFWGQPVRRASVLEFRPTFTGVAQGQYPNGLAFAGSDVAAAPIVDLVYDGNLIAEYCSREAFRGGFFVEQRSDASAFLDAEYQSRLSDARITPVERQRLQAEYEAKRAALPVQFRLVFVKPRPCAAIPQVVVTKAMSDVLTTWASESETKRGVLNLQVEVLTPAVMDVGLSEESSRLLRADLIRTALWRVANNVKNVGEIPGSELVRLGSNRTTFAEIHNKVIDLVRSRLEPLVATAGQSMVRESTQWVTETVASAEREQQAAEGRAAAYLTALREYSGAAQTAQANRASAPTGAQGTDVQTLSPQVDRTFIDRIVEMSEANTTFRRTLTESMVKASVDAVAAKDRAEYYRRLLQSLRSPSSSSLEPAQVDARLNEIVSQAKALIADFNSLYDEFSRVSLRAAASLYQTDKPVTTEVSREFTTRSLLMLVVGTFFVTLLLAFGFFVVRDRLREAPAS